MGVFCLKFDGARIAAEIFLNLTSGNLVRRMFFFALSCVPLLGKYYGFSEEYRRTYSSPAAAVPVHRPAGSRKEKLALIDYGRLRREGDSECAICLRCIEARDRVRELGNCSHVFHKECIDTWMDQGKLTCPLCRSKLLPDAEDHSYR